MFDQTSTADAALSALLLPGAADAWLDRARPELFPAGRPRLALEAMRALHTETGRIDPALLTDRLRNKDGELLGYVLDLLSSETATSAFLGDYLDALEASRRRRDFEVILRESADEAQGGEPTEELIGRLESRLLELRPADHRGPVQLRDALADGFDLAARRAAGEVGISTGLVDLDRAIGGLEPGALHVVAGRPSMGKTTLALNLARNVAEAGIGALLFCLEMPSAQLALNIASASARVPAWSFRTAAAGRSSMNRMMAKAEGLVSAPFWIDDSGEQTPMKIRSTSRRLKARKPMLGLIVVDYIQLMAPDRDLRNRVLELAETSRALKRLARELELPVIAVSQLSRAVEQRDDKRPRISDLRDSGAIEQDADLILMLYREEYYKPSNAEAQGVAEVIVAKNRNGPTGTVPLRFDGPTFRFDNLARAEFNRESNAPRIVSTRRDLD